MQRSRPNFAHRILTSRKGCPAHCRLMPQEEADRSPWTRVGDGRRNRVSTIMTSKQPERASAGALDLLDPCGRAANYLSVGQIYLLDNPPLREPLRPEHIKPRLLGHWGTTPGLNFIYAHLNRA